MTVSIWRCSDCGWDTGEISDADDQDYAADSHEAQTGHAVFAVLVEASD